MKGFLRRPDAVAEEQVYLDPVKVHEALQHPYRDPHFEAQFAIDVAYSMTKSWPKSWKWAMDAVSIIAHKFADVPGDVRVFRGYRFEDEQGHYGIYEVWEEPKKCWLNVAGELKEIKNQYYAR